MRKIIKIRCVCRECKTPFEYDYFRGMKRTYCSTLCRLKFNGREYRKKHPEKIKEKDRRRYIRLHDAISLINACCQDHRSLLCESDAELYARIRAANRRAHAKSRRKLGHAKGPYKPRLYMRIPDHFTKGSCVFDNRSVFIRNNHSLHELREVDGYYRELSIERYRQTREIIDD